MNELGGQETVKEKRERRLETVKRRLAELRRARYILGREEIESAEEKREGVQPIEGAQPPAPSGLVEPGRPLVDSAVKKRADHGAVPSTGQRREGAV